MPSPRKITIETDGASRGNPGLAGAGVIIKDDHGRRIETIQKFLGVTTNNQAEYRALIEGLRAANGHKPNELTVKLESNLVANKIRGRSAFRHPKRWRLSLEGRVLVRGSGKVRSVLSFGNETPERTKWRIWRS